jgi:murein DD-endopeptidase MepM/ murein hydrolase activator NlpD
MASNNAPPADVTSSLPAGQVDTQQLPPPSYPNVAATGAQPGYGNPYQGTPLDAPAGPRSARGPAVNTTANAGIHVVAPGETINSLARLYGKPVRIIAQANGLTVDTKLRIGQRVTIPGVTQAQIKTGATMAQAAPAAAKPASASQPAQAQAAPQKVASAEPAASVNLASPATDSPAADNDNGTPSFRWPVRGRVIAGFGAKTGGQQNDGINLSVPEGTSVKAAEDGVVAYAGNELKGYGNLVLVRHSAGFVTAYAHASEVMVKRGDRVKRGQIIARAGQTGNVNAPQLHFEIRKGSTPVDPMQFLQSTRADL